MGASTQPHDITGKCHRANKVKPTDVIGVINVPDVRRNIESDKKLRPKTLATSEQLSDWSSEKGPEDLRQKWTLGKKEEKKKKVGETES